MKINEVTARQINEGPLDFAKKVGAGIQGFKQGGLAGAKAGWQASSSQTQGKKELNDYSDAAFQNWNEYQAKTGIKDPVRWAKNFYRNPDVTKIPLTTNTPIAVKNWITTLSQKFKSGELSPVPDYDPTAQEEPTPTPAANDDPAVFTPGGNRAGNSTWNPEPEAPWTVDYNVPAYKRAGITPAEPTPIPKQTPKQASPQPKTQSAVDVKMPVNKPPVQTPATKPKVSYNDYSKELLGKSPANLKVSAPKSSGAPTNQEYANLQSKLKAALDAQK